MNVSTPTSQGTPKIYTHPDRPAWGRGVVATEQPGKVFLHFEDGSERIIARDFLSKLQKVELPEEEARAVAAAIGGKRGAKGPSKAKRAARVTASIDFDEQLRRFDTAFPGGFEGDKYLDSERGRAGAPLGTGGKGTKQGAIDHAQTILAPSAFGDPAQLYAGALQLLAATNLVFPIEGAIPFRKMKPEHHPAFAEALHDLLHGDAPYATRFDKYVAAIHLEESSGAPRKPTWPLVTLLPALYRPSEEIFVKPGLLRQQAAILRMPLNYDSLPSGAVYRQFQDVAKELAERLQENGQRPRDLMDVYAFVATALAAT